MFNIVYDSVLTINLSITTIPPFTYFQEIVHQYIVAQNIIAAQFKDNRPGLAWLKNFMARNNITHKKAEMISCARKANTSNPFIIYDFYEQLEEVYIAFL